MTDDIKMPCEIALEADAELMKLFEEIDNERGQDSAFMDDNFGGWVNENNNSNLFNSSYRTWRIYILS